MNSMERLEDMELTVRAYNCLRRAGVQTLGDLADLIGTDLSALTSVRNLGYRCMREILTFLKTNGYSVESATERYIQNNAASFSPANLAIWQEFLESLYQIHPTHEAPKSHTSFSIPGN